MQRYFSILLWSLLMVSCGCGPARTHDPHTPAPTPPVSSAPAVRYTYVVRNTYPHQAESYTQGLQFIDGELWEGTGEYGHSQLLVTDLSSGRTLRTVVRLPRSEFGEGITVLGDSVFQLTWTSNTAHLYNRKTGDKIRDFQYTGEGWGLTTDGRKLYMSDGTERIHTIDPATFRRERSVSVTLDGVPIRLINELEWIDGKIWANVYTTDQIVIIDPETGVIEGVVDLTGLLPDTERTPHTDVLNGIAYDADAGRIFVTGKRWSKLFEVEIIKQ